jgi:acetyltransferase-like isoleucine patch superfamily enzyme
MNAESAFIHPTANVAESAELCDDVKIWRWTCVREGARIGCSTKVGQHCYIDVDVTVGPFCRIQNSVNIFSGVVIGPGVFIGPGVQFTNVRLPRRGTIVPPEKYETTVVSEGASLGAGAIIRCGVIIGPDAIVGAGAVVTRNVPGLMEVVGNPARPVRHHCREIPDGLVSDRVVIGSNETINIRCKGCGKQWTT